MKLRELCNLLPLNEICDPIIFAAFFKILHLSSSIPVCISYLVNFGPLFIFSKFSLNLFSDSILSSSDYVCLMSNLSFFFLGTVGFSSHVPYSSFI